MYHKKISSIRLGAAWATFILLPVSAQALNCPYGNTNPLCGNNQLAEQAQERAAEQARERAAEQAQERAAEQARERAAEQAQERAAEQARERAAEQARERAAEQARERAAEQARERAAEQARERAAEQARERATEQARERAAEQARERASEQARERASEQARERASEQARERSAEQGRERSAEQARERATDQARERTAGQARERSAEQARERTVEQTRERAVPERQVRGDQTREHPVETAHERVPESESGSKVAAAPAAPRAIPISNSTVMYSTPGRSGYRAEKAISGRSTLVVTQHVAPHSGKAVIQAYRQTTSADGKVTTRVYSDGTRTVQAPSFSSRGVIGGIQLVHYTSGLRAAYASNGRAIYAEAFVHRPGVTDHQVIQRTIYSTRVQGVIRPLGHPVYHYYTIVPVAGYATYVYEPVAFMPGFFVPLYTPFGAPLLVGPACVLCPPATVAFNQGVSQYADPMELLGDQQIADAAAGDPAVAPDDDPQAAPSDDPQVDAGQVIGPDSEVAEAPAPVAEPEPPPPPELLAEDTAQSASAAPELLGSLSNQAHEVTGEIEAHYRNAVATTTSDAAEQPVLEPAAATSAESVESAMPLDIPEEARQQIHKQVRLSVAQHANHHGQSLGAILGSGYAHIYLFQVDAPLQVADLTSGQTCTLSDGELLRVVDASDPKAVQVRVIASRPGHCGLDDTVQTSADALQDMLNTFNLRIECNMRKIRKGMATLST